MFACSFVVVGEGIFVTIIIVKGGLFLCVLIFVDVSDCFCFLGLVGLLWGLFIHSL